MRIHAHTGGNMRIEPARTSNSWFRGAEVRYSPFVDPGVIVVVRQGEKWVEVMAQQPALARSELVRYFAGHPLSHPWRLEFWDTWLRDGRWELELCEARELSGAG